MRGFMTGRLALSCTDLNAAREKTATKLMQLLIFGAGYTGAAVLRAAAAAGLRATATSRTATGRTATGRTAPGRTAPGCAVPGPTASRLVPFAAADAAIAAATHILSTVGPAAMPGAAPGQDAQADPVLARWGEAIARAPALRWIGYISSTGVYGDRQGGWVDERTAPAPGQDRSRRRRQAEREWERFADRYAVDLFRTAGIYGPGRSALDELRAGRARRVLRPGHCFGRVHVDDIAGAVLAAARQDRPPGLRVLHLADDAPAESAAVIEEAARLLGVEPPAAIPYEQAAMSDMARSFWAEDRKVHSRLTQQWLGRNWLYPSYREGLRAILAEQRAEDAAQQGQVGGA
jgi:nucleoside-diphosphate-sugar epimerase